MTDPAKTQTVSRAAVSQPLEVLEDAGLVKAEAQGARRVYGIYRGALQDLRAPVKTFEVWCGQKNAFEVFPKKMDTRLPLGKFAVLAKARQRVGDVIPRSWN